MRIAHLVLPILVAGVVGACGSDSKGGKCDKIAGTWAVNGSCTETGSTTCQITQTGCSFDMDCADGLEVSGKVTSSGLTFKVNADGTSTSCEGKFDENDGTVTVEGDCEAGGDTVCSFEGACQDGDCEDGGGGNGGTSGNGGTGGSSGSGGTGGSSGSGGSGGTGGSPPSACENGAAALCDCGDQAGVPCTNTEYNAAIQQCEDGVEPTTGWLLCLNEEITVSDGRVTNCEEAINYCIPDEGAQ